MDWINYLLCNRVVNGSFRDKDRCEMCGWNKYPFLLSDHHIPSKSKRDYKKYKYVPRIKIRLCPYCHHREHHIERYTKKVWRWDNVDEYNERYYIKVLNAKDRIRVLFKCLFDGEEDGKGCPLKYSCVIVKYYNDKFRCVGDLSICWWMNEDQKSKEKCIK